MRHRSLTNSRNHESVALQKAYKADNVLDEIIYLFPCSCGKALIPTGEPTSKAQPRRISLPAEATELHHIKGARPKYDYVWNFIHLSEPVHTFATRFKFDVAALAISVKIRKGEFDFAAWREITGKDVEGWLQEPKFSWARPYWREVLEHSRREAA